MTGPRRDQDVERALSAWMDEVAPTRPPVRLLEETFATTMRARQDGARLTTVETAIFGWLGSFRHPRFRDALALIK